MKYRGVVYDVGLNFNDASPLSVDPWNPALAAHDIHTIAHDLHANAIRIEGEPIERLTAATRLAHAQGLKVFFNPWLMHATPAQTLPYLADAARAAAALQRDGIDLVFVVGCEASLFGAGLLAGASLNDRIASLAAAAGASGPTSAAAMDSLARPLNAALAQFARAVRAHFAGLLTYAAGQWERVDWTLFDAVGVDHYRAGESSEAYVAALAPYRVGKPLAVMEVGSCCFAGAGALGAGGFMVLQGRAADGSGVFRDGVVPQRSEREQAAYLEAQIGLLARAGVDAVFVYVFSFPCMRAGEGARDFDMVSFSLVKTWDEGDERSTAMPPWAPKEAFYSVAECFRRLAEDEGDAAEWS